MSFYESLKNTASKLLKDKGQLVTFTRKVTAGFDPVTGIDTPASSTTFTGYGAAFDYNSSQIDGTLIKAGDIRFLFEATDTAPLEEDTTVIDSVIYVVKNVKKTSPAGTVVMYEVQLRK